MLADAATMATGRADHAATESDEYSIGAGNDAGARPFGRGIVVAAEVGEAAAAVQRVGLPPTVATAVD